MLPFIFYNFMSKKQLFFKLSAYLQFDYGKINN
ncbi:hypothetical protein J2S14_001710 [Lederbergia wuyishanensis]|uniref:Uncharacterized protein n=1 Tax=Lederbergia wuyishanensis TaxID=1347903 RepID=A0ABU0D3E3_9BACI|nr:hypothetical protein [Lederbergia wuyishanensis]